MNWETIVSDLAEENSISTELSTQVEALTQFLGEIVREKEDEAFWKDLVDFPRLAARAFDGKDEQALAEVQERIQKLPTGHISRLLRYYTVFFHLMNSQEQREITRINRERAINTRPDSPRNESIAEAVHFLKEEGLDARQAAQVIGKLDIQPTITAHPTEARRHSVLLKQQHITKMINRLSRNNLTPQERHQKTMEILNELHLLLATDEVRSERVTVEDEVENGMFFFMNSIWETIPVLYEDLRDAFKTYYEEVPDFSTILRYRSWIGSDRDGNPNVTSDVTWQTILEQRKNVLNLYLDELKDLRRYLSISENKYTISGKLRESLEKDEQSARLSEREQRLYQKEPYRRKITHMMRKLRHQQEMIAGGNKAEIIEEAGSYTAGEFIAELELMAGSLRTNGLKGVGRVGKLNDLIIRARTFGFHIAALDIRQHSKVHEEAVSELLTVAEVTGGYQDLPEEEKVALLTDELRNPRPLSPVHAHLGEQTAQMLEVFGIIRDMLRLDPASFGEYIISMTHGVSDLLEVLILAKEVGLWSLEEGQVQSRINVVPLFETIEDLEVCGQLMTDIFESELYRRHLEARDNLQEIMLGYSDSNKDGGYWMANWALEKAQQKLGRVCRDYDIDFRLFHGRGGTVGRGGGRSNQAILALPPISNNGRIRFTEQGEVISFRYSLPAITRRHLEQIVNAMIRVTVAKNETTDEYDTFFDTMEQLSQRSMNAYRNLIDDEGFWEWYTNKTPIEHISRLPIASRPVSRGSAKAADFGNLRAIPWVFAWTQVRYNVPGWYGLGAALGEMLEKEELSAEQFQRWYKEGIFFRTILDNAQREMARTHLQTSSIYPDNDGGEFDSRITRDFQKAVEAILEITGQEQLLDHSPVIKKSINFRNPFTYPLNMMQVELLDRWHSASGLGNADSRNSEDAPGVAGNSAAASDSDTASGHRNTGSGEKEKDLLRDALFLSINGVAAAMQSTG